MAPWVASSRLAWHALCATCSPGERKARSQGFQRPSYHRGDASVRIADAETRIKARRGVRVGSPCVLRVRIWHGTPRRRGDRDRDPAGRATGSTCSRASSGQPAKCSPGAHSPDGIRSPRPNVRMVMRRAGCARTAEMASLDGHAAGAPPAPGSGGPCSRGDHSAERVAAARSGGGVGRGVGTVPRRPFGSVPR